LAAPVTASVTFETGPLPLDEAVVRLAAERFDDDPPLLARVPPERFDRELLPLARLLPERLERVPPPLARLLPELLAARLLLVFAALALRLLPPLVLRAPPERLEPEPLALARLLPEPLALVRAGRLLCAIAFPPRCQSGSSRRTDARQRTEMSR
jgi:hypothetical protein